MPPQVVSERELTLKELAQHDGSDPDKPLLLAIRGTVFDITPGALPHSVTVGIRVKLRVKPVPCADCTTIDCDAAFRSLRDMTKLSSLDDNTLQKHRAEMLSGESCRFNIALGRVSSSLAIYAFADYHHHLGGRAS